MYQIPQSRADFFPNPSVKSYPKLSSCQISFGEFEELLLRSEEWVEVICRVCRCNRWWPETPTGWTFTALTRLLIKSTVSFLTSLLLPHLQHHLIHLFLSFLLTSLQTLFPWTAPCMKPKIRCPGFGASFSCKLFFRSWHLLDLMFHEWSEKLHLIYEFQGIFISDEEGGGLIFTLEVILIR